MDTLPLLLQCVAHDYALHELKHASVLARRLARNADAQKELAAFQLELGRELSARKNADQFELPTDADGA